MCTYACMYICIYTITETITTCFFSGTKEDCDAMEEYDDDDEEKDSEVAKKQRFDENDEPDS